MTQRVGKLHIERRALFCCSQYDSSPATTYSCLLVIGGAHPILSVRWRLSRLTCPLTLLLLLLHLKYVYRYHRYYLIGILLGFCYAVNVFLLWPSKKNQQRVLMCHPGISANNWRKKVSTSSRRIPKLFIKVLLVLSFSLFFPPSFQTYSLLRISWLVLDETLLRKYYIIKLLL